MRVVVSAALGVLVATSAFTGVQAQAPTEAGSISSYDVFTSWRNTKAYACVFNQDLQITVLEEREDGSLQLVPEDSELQAHKSDGRIVITNGADYFYQIDGDNSVYVIHGQTANGTCRDVSDEFRDVVVVWEGVYAQAAESERNRDLLNALEARTRQMDDLSAELDAAIAAMRSANEPGAAMAQTCLDQLREPLESLLHYLEQEASPDTAPGLAMPFVCQRRSNFRPKGGAIVGQLACRA